MKNHSLLVFRQISRWRFFSGLFIIIAGVVFVSAIASSVSADCTSDQQCRQRDGSRPYCDPGGRGTCVQCMRNSQCKTNESCQQNKCVAAPTTAPTTPPVTVPPPTNGPSGTVCSATNADIMLVIDTSNSMLGGNLDRAKVAAVDFVNIVAKNPTMRVGLATFNEKGHLISGLTSPANVVSAINNLSIPNNQTPGTCLECAVDADKGDADVMGAFNSVPANGNKRVVIVLTDGKINRWMQADGSISGSQTSADEQKARDQATGAIGRVYATHAAQFWMVQYGLRDNETWLRSLVSTYDGTGSYYHESELSLDGVYKRIANELLGGSVTAFTFFDQNKNGSFDTGDQPLANVSVSLNATVKQTGTDGKATFDKLCPATYTLTVTKPDSYTVPTGSTLTRSVSLTSGSSITENFPFIRDGTIAPNTFSLKLALHGLGIAGDNVLPRPAACRKDAAASTSAAECLSNVKPNHPERDFSIEAINASNQIVATMSGKITYSSDAGIFTSDVKFTPGLNTGYYSFRVLTPMFLKKKILFTQQVEPGKTYDLPLTDMTSSDVDNDNHLTILDYNMIVSCYQFPNLSNPCNADQLAEVDNADNGIVDDFNINLFVRDLINQQGD